MKSPEVTKVIGYALLWISFFSFALWAAATMGFAPDLHDKKAQSFWQMHRKHSPPWWQKFSRWVLGIALVLGVVGYFLSGPHPKLEPRVSPWRQLFSRDK